MATYEPTITRFHTDHQAHRQGHPIETSICSTCRTPWPGSSVNGFVSSARLRLFRTQLTIHHQSPGATSLASVAITRQSATDAAQTFGFDGDKLGHAEHTALTHEVDSLNLRLDPGQALVAIIRPG